MKRRQLLHKIRTNAQKQGLTLEQVRDRGSHTIYRVGGVQFSLPRHVDVNELTARSIFKHLESELGRGWWQ